MFFTSEKSICSKKSYLKTDELSFSEILVLFIFSEGLFSMVFLPGEGSLLSHVKKGRRGSLLNGRSGGAMSAGKYSDWIRNCSDFPCKKSRLNVEHIFEALVLNARLCGEKQFCISLCETKDSPSPFIPSFSASQKKGLGFSLSSPQK